MKCYKIKYHLFCSVRKFFLLFHRRIKINKGVSWRRNFSIIVEGRGEITIGANCFFNNDCSIVSRGQVVIGSGTLFGENVKIYDHNHKFNDFDKPLKDQGFSVGKVTIGSHCWIGSNVTILKGSVIGNNCVIGAGCIISGVVPDNTLVKISEKSFRFEEIRNNG